MRVNNAHFKTRQNTERNGGQILKSAQNIKEIARSGGGGGSRTRVREYAVAGIYMRSRS